MGHIHYRSQKSFFSRHPKNKILYQYSNHFSLFQFNIPLQQIIVILFVTPPKKLGPKSQFLYWRIYEKVKMREERIMYNEGRKTTLNLCYNFLRGLKCSVNETHEGNF
jgi:hypothetical protein